MSYDERVDAARRLLAEVERDHARAAIACSFGAEDMVLVDLAARDGLALDVFMLDTGRLPRETLALAAKVQHDYGIKIQRVHPWPGAVDAFVEEYGIDGFYDGIDARKACCAVRKVEPLKRALAGRRAWITGLRRDQADSRANVQLAEYDAAQRQWKYSPLADWSEEDVWTYLRANDVPTNALHARGYPSIGCEPCTRAVKPGEHPRAGRWWWEGSDARKECGLHEIPVKVIA